MIALHRDHYYINSSGGGGGGGGGGGRGTHSLSLIPDAGGGGGRHGNSLGSSRVYVLEGPVQLTTVSLDGHHFISFLKR